MNIGILALAVAAFLAPIALIGIKYNKPPQKTEKEIRYPYPKELL